MDIKEVLKQTREEFDEHLDSINANTNEIQTNYEFMCRLESKIDKLNERLDEMQILLNPGHETQKNSLVHPLTKHEKEVFLVLYEAGENFITHIEIGKHLGLTEDLVREYVMNVIAKGIPIVKRYVNNKAYIKIDTDFRNLQTRENVVEIEQGISKRVFN